MPFGLTKLRIEINESGPTDWLMKTIKNPKNITRLEFNSSSNFKKKIMKEMSELKKILSNENYPNLAFLLIAFKEFKKSDLDKSVVE